MPPKKRKSPVKKEKPPAPAEAPAAAKKAAAAAKEPPHPPPGRKPAPPGASKTPVKRSSEHKGVSWVKGRRRWQAQIRFDGKVRHLGYFEDENAAAGIYFKAAAAKASGEPIAPSKGGQSSSSKHKGVCWAKKANAWNSPR